MQRDPARAQAGATPFAAWLPRLRAVTDDLREHTRASLLAAHAAGERERVTREARQGLGDVSFGLDLPGEEWIARWHAELARDEPLSVLTEETGWRHLGPAPGGGSRELPGFDHGGPRIAFDPVDGTRNLMFDLRSAWTVVSFADPGPGTPRFAELTGALVSELPGTNALRFRRVVAARGAGARLEQAPLDDPTELDEAPLAADEDDRADRGYFPFFRYEPALRPDLARLEAAFFARLVEREGADARTLWDDQYICNAGQLVLLALGTYRLVCDARALVARRAGVPTVTSKPYDVAGALLAAQEAGAVVTRADGTPLDFPIDATTPVDMIGYANAATHARLAPHWRAVLAEPPR